MKIIKIEPLIDVGPFSKTPEWETIKTHIVQAVKAVQWPPGSGSFTLHDQPGKRRGQGNGVKPIKDACMIHLKSMAWDLEIPLDLATLSRPGKIDAIYRVGAKLFAVEWETGNISSSHRALNKMALGLLKQVLIGGVLIVPTRKMYQYLTDRVGNYQELIPYFPVWQALASSIDEGLLAVIVVEHDGVSKDVPRIPKGTDGRALT